jgi:drug/metabolite transporter (DMT)-like permease
MLHTLLYFLALFSLSTSSTWAKLNQMPVEVLGFWRLFIAALAMGTWVLFKHKKHLHLRHPKILWVIGSAFFFFLHLATYKFASKNTTISNTMILFATNPVWASLGAIAFFKEKLTYRLVISYFLALAGIYILVFRHLQFNSSTIYGDASSVLSALFYAAYMLTSKKARQHFDNSFFSFILYGVCAICFATTVFITQKDFIRYTQISWVSVAGLVLLPTFLGHLSFTYLVKTMDLTLMSCGKLIEPLFAAVIAYYVFHEVLNEDSWIAFTLTSISILILFGPELLKKRQKI